MFMILDYACVMQTFVKVLLSVSIAVAKASIYFSQAQTVGHEILKYRIDTVLNIFLLTVQ